MIPSFNQDRYAECFHFAACAHSILNHGRAFLPVCTSANGIKKLHCLMYHSSYSSHAVLLKKITPVAVCRIICKKCRILSQYADLYCRIRCIPFELKSGDEYDNTDFTKQWSEHPKGEEICTLYLPESNVSKRPRQLAVWSATKGTLVIWFTSWLRSRDVAKLKILSQYGRSSGIWITNPGDRL